MRRMFFPCIALVLSLFLAAPTALADVSPFTKTDEGLEFSLRDQQLFLKGCIDPYTQYADYEQAAPADGHRYVDVLIYSKKQADNSGQIEFEVLDTQGNKYMVFLGMKMGDGSFKSISEIPITYEGVASIPEDMPLSDLTFTATWGDDAVSYNLGDLAEALAPGGESTAGAPSEVPEPLEGLQVGGYTLTLQAPGTFEEITEGQVYTGVGDTNLSSGATAWPGSSLLMKTIRGSKQFGMLLVTFTYAPASDPESDAETLFSIAQTATLVDGGATYRPAVAWAIDKYLCLVFDDASLKGAALTCALNDGALVISKAENSNT